MSAPRNRADELLEMWSSATARPVPAFVARPRRRRSMRPAILLATAALVILALVVGAVLLSASGPAPTPRFTPAPSSGPPAGFKRFDAPGIRFDYPADWTDQSDAFRYPPRPQIRDVAILARGLTVCPEPDPKPTPAPGCQTDPTEPGSMVFSIFDYPDQLPDTHGVGTETTIAGHPVWEGPEPTDLKQPWQSMEWTVRAPDRGMYLVAFRSPPADLAAHKAEVLALLGTLHLSAWETPPTAVNGYIHLALAEGFSFDYPVGWTLYYPDDNSMMDTAIVTVASSPVLPPCGSDQCQRFTTPPNTVVVEFRAGNGPQAPDWTKATGRLGGQPAFDLGAWGPINATGAEVGHSWSARLTDPSILGIDLSIRGPNLPSLQSAGDGVLRSLQITRRPTPTP